MASSPFDRRKDSIPVTVVERGPLPLAGPDAVVVRLEAALLDHGHGADASACPVCTARGSVRLQLFELLEGVRRGERPAFSHVIVDATGLADPAAVIDELVPGRVPAFGLRDHTVARSFHLAGDDAAS